jgi:hypothetical protein
MYLCVARGSQNKERVFLYIVLTGWFFNRDSECLLRGTNWIFKLDTYSSILKGLKYWMLTDTLLLLFLIHY